MMVIFETESGAIVTDEIFVRTGVAYEVRTEVVGEQGSAMIGLDQNLQLKSTDGRWGGKITPGFVERFGQAYDTELQRWVDAAQGWTRSTARAPGTATRRSRSARPACRQSGAGQKVHVHLAGGSSSGITRRSRNSRRHTGPRPGRSVAVKLALDPQMFYSTSSVYELPDIVASLGYDWMELSPKADFVPFFKYPRVDDAGVKRAEEGRRRRGRGHRLGAAGAALVWSGRRSATGRRTRLEAGHPDHRRSGRRGDELGVQRHGRRRRRPRRRSS